MSNYENKSVALAKLFKALSNPNRLAIFQRLLNCCEPGQHAELDQCVKMIVGEIGKEVDVAPSTLSHHLKELNQAGLIVMQRKGQHIECWVNQEAVQQIQSFLN